MPIIRFYRCWLAACLVSLGGASAAAGDAGQALLQAAADGDAARVKTLLAGGAPLEARDAQGNTPLLRATQGNHAEAAGALIEAGADVNAQNGIQDSAYLLAGARGYHAILALTLAHGADLKSTNRYGGTALIPACERGHVEVVDMLLRAGVDPDHVNRLGWTGLLEAIILGDGGTRHQAIVARLIEGGADVNLADGDGVSPLRHARQRGQTAIVQLLEAAHAR